MIERILPDTIRINDTLCRVLLKYLLVLPMLHEYETNMQAAYLKYEYIIRFADLMWGHLVKGIAITVTSNTSKCNCWSRVWLCQWMHYNHICGLLFQREVN